MFILGVFNLEKEEPSDRGHLIVKKNLTLGWYNASDAYNIVEFMETMEKFSYSCAVSGVWIFYKNYKKLLSMTNE